LPEQPIAFLGGRIFTMVPGSMSPDVVVVVGERIVAVGSREVLNRFPGAVVHDLDGRTLCPGFIDAHHHLSIAALQPRWADVRSVRTIEELGTALQAHARREPDTPWIRAAGWTEIETGLVPHRGDLDALELDRPILLAHYSLHQGVTDSKGLEELGIDIATPDPPGGTIGRDTDGRPNGLLVERAWSEAHRRSLAPYDDPDRWAEHIESAAASLLADGITAVHDTACSPEAEAAYHVLARSGRLPISVLACPHPSSLFAPPDDARLSDGPCTGDGDPWLRVGPVKLFADGGVLPAIDVHLHGSRLTFGSIFNDLETHVEHAVSRGFRVCVHAIGNAGLEAALDAFKSSAARHPDGDHRFRIEHACLASTPQLRRLAELGGVAVVQPAFLHHLGGQIEGAEFDDATWLPFASIRKAGVTMAASSDCPCTFQDPLRGAGHGASRRTSSGARVGPDEAVPLEEWLWAYTAGAAYAGGQECERGTLAAGHRADLVVLEGPLVAEPLPKVAQTWVAGRLVFGSPLIEGQPPQAEIPHR
jgi:predicted amidohydrolase YtcJ